MKIKALFLAAALGLPLLATAPASAQHNTSSYVQPVNHYSDSRTERNYIPLRRLYRILRAHRYGHWRGRHYSNRSYRHEGRRARSNRGRQGHGDSHRRRNSY